MGREGSPRQRAVHEVASRVPWYIRELLGLQRLSEIEITSNLLALGTFNRYLGMNTRTFTCDDAHFNILSSISRSGNYLPNFFLSFFRVIFYLK